MSTALTVQLYERDGIFARRPLSFRAALDEFNGAPDFVAAALLADERAEPVALRHGSRDYVIELAGKPTFLDFDDALHRARGAGTAPVETPLLLTHDSPAEDDLPRFLDVPVQMRLFFKVRLRASSERQAVQMLMAAAAHERLPEPRHGQSSRELRELVAEASHAAMSAMMAQGDPAAGDWSPDITSLVR